MKHEPHHFTREDLLRSFFGSFIVSLSFIFAGALQEVALNMTPFNVFCVLTLTFVMLTVEIYLLSYKYVNDRKRRPFLEFWAKRFFSIILSSYIAITLLLFAYGMNFTLVPNDLFNMGVAIFLPATTAGGAMEILRNK
jgi:uncharacterized membrane protein